MRLMRFSWFTSLSDDLLLFFKVVFSLRDREKCVFVCLGGGGGPYLPWCSTELCMALTLAVTHWKLVKTNTHTHTHNPAHNI